MKALIFVLLLPWWSLACSPRLPAVRTPSESFDADRPGPPPASLDEALQRLEHVIPADAQVRLRRASEHGRTGDWDVVEHTINQWLLERPSALRTRLGAQYSMSDDEMLTAAMRSFLQQLRDEPVDVASTLRDMRARADTHRHGRRDALQLRLDVIRAPADDLHQTVLRLTATNTSDVTLVIDRDAVVGFHLVVGRDAPDGAPEVRRSDRQPPQDEASRRLAPLEPGESITRELDLTRPVRSVHSGFGISAIDRLCRVMLFQSETLVAVPPRARQLTAQVRYRLDHSAASWLLDASDIWLGQAASNSVTVNIPAAAGL